MFAYFGPGASEVLVVVVLVVLGLLIWGLKNPAVWRLLAVVAIAIWRLVAVLAIAVGIGLLVWGITAAALGEQPWRGATPAAIIGGGAGSLVGGIVLLVVSFLRRSTRHTSERQGSDQE